MKLQNFIDNKDTMCRYVYIQEILFSGTFPYLKLQVWPLLNNVLLNRISYNYVVNIERKFQLFHYFFGKVMRLLNLQQRYL